MNRPGFEVELELDGWELFFSDLQLHDAAQAPLGELLAATGESLRAELKYDQLTQLPAVAALRRLFREAGCDPTRYRPSSEALLRRILKGEEIPAIHPLVDLNNCLSARMAVPCCVMAEGTFSPPFVFRAGKADESYESLRGDFRLDGKPLLVDAQGPCDAPITGGQRVKVCPGTRLATLVAYLPLDLVTAESVAAALRDLLTASPVAAIENMGAARPPLGATFRTSP